MGPGRHRRQGHPAGAQLIVAHHAGDHIIEVNTGHLSLISTATNSDDAIEHAAQAAS